jgi:hypothetical protein
MVVDLKSEVQLQKNVHRNLPHDQESEQSGNQSHRKRRDPIRGFLSAGVRHCSGCQVRNNQQTTGAQRAGKAIKLRVENSASGFRLAEHKGEACKMRLRLRQQLDRSQQRAENVDSQEFQP